MGAQKYFPVDLIPILLKKVLNKFEQFTNLGRDTTILELNRLEIKNF